MFRSASNGFMKIKVWIPETPVGNQNSSETAPPRMKFITITWKTSTIIEGKPAEPLEQPKQSKQDENQN